MPRDRFIAPPSLSDVQLVMPWVLREVLRAGWRDFRAAPGIGLATSLPFVLGGAAAELALAGLAPLWWLIPVCLLLPVLGPFGAAVLYRTSRRHAAGQGTDPRGLPADLARQARGPLFGLAMAVLAAVLLWIVLAHLLRLWLIGPAPFALTWPDLLGFGLAELLAGVLLGLTLFALTILGLPVVAERAVEPGEAMFLSLLCVAHNPGPMTLCALGTGGLLVFGALPLGLGLLVVLPVLGHAGWHLYRHALRPDQG